MKGCESEDPVEEIRETVADSFAKALSLEVLESDRRTQAKDAEDVIKDYPGADLILDIRTSKWGIHRVEAPSTRGEVHFAVGYQGWLRLIDECSGAALWTAVFPPGNLGPGPGSSRARAAPIGLRSLGWVGSTKRIPRRSPELVA